MIEGLKLQKCLNHTAHIAVTRAFLQIRAIVNELSEDEVNVSVDSDEDEEIIVDLFDELNRQNPTENPDGILIVKDKS